MAEKEYIEREKAYTLAKKICDAVNSGTRTLFLGRDILDWIDDLPAADVRPVVLCRDCKHNKGAKVWRFLDLEDTTANCSAGHGYPPMDWFCADGEKREES